MQAAQNVAEVSVEEENHLRLVIDTIPTMAWSLRPDGSVDFVNQRWLDYTGFSRQEALSKANTIVHADDFPWVSERWLEDKDRCKPFEYAMRLRRMDGEYRWFLVRTVPLADDSGRVVKWYGTSTDIEDRVRAEDALRQAAAQLQALSRRLVEVQEFERKELARELHDRVGQSLTALNINLAILRQGLAPGNAAIRSRLDDSSALLDLSMEAIRDVLADLRPQMLDDHGLRAALEWYAMEFSNRSGIAVSVRTEAPESRLAAHAEIALFRIAQEALNNVAKHAKADRIEIFLETGPSGCVMAVADNGIGLGPAAEGSIGSRHGLGMVTMRERAQAIGGEVRVEALLPRGTRLEVRVPNAEGGSPPEGAPGR